MPLNFQFCKLNCNFRTLCERALIIFCDQTGLHNKTEHLANIARSLNACSCRHAQRHVVTKRLVLKLYVMPFGGRTALVRIRSWSRARLLTLYASVAGAYSCNAGKLSQSHACMVTPDLSTCHWQQSLHAAQAPACRPCLCWHWWQTRIKVWLYRKLERACAFRWLRSDRRCQSI